MAIDNEMGDRLEKVERGLEKVEHRLEKVEHGLEKVDHKVDQLANATKIRFERIHDDIKKLGEGYEAGLKQISRQIEALDARWADQWTPHDLALKNHGKRILTLEQQAHK